MRVSSGFATNKGLFAFYFFQHSVSFWVPFVNGSYRRYLSYGKLESFLDLGGF